MPVRNTHNIVTFEIDDQIVGEVQQRAGIDYSAAVRTIIREFGRINGLPESATKPVVRETPRKARKVAGRKQLSNIPGVSKGLVN